MNIQIISATLLLLIFAAIAVKFFAPMMFQYLLTRYSRNHTKINGAKAARQMLKHSGITDIHVSCHQFSNRNDNCYDTELKAVFLAPAVYHGHTVPDIAIACHEAAHAIQHHEKFKGILPFTMFIELDANRKAIKWLKSDLARSVGGLNKWAAQSRSLLRWSFLTYLF